MTRVSKLITLETIPEFQLRPDDAAECLAGGMTPEIAVRRSVAGSQQAFAQYIEDDLVCLWGWRWDDYIQGYAVMWLLTTGAADKHKVAFGRCSRRFLILLQERFNKITILVHTKHNIAILWLEWLGFERSRAMTQDFIEMERKK